MTERPIEPGDVLGHCTGCGQPLMVAGPRWPIPLKGITWLFSWLAEQLDASDQDCVIDSRDPERLRVVLIDPHVCEDR